MPWYARVNLIATSDRIVSGVRLPERFIPSKKYSGLHGITAAPLAKAYGKMTDELGDCAERLPTEELPLRSGLPATGSE